MADSTVETKPAGAAVGVGGYPADFLSVDDLTPEQLVEVLDLADRVKADPAPYSSALSGKHVAMLFEKPSLRTRISFDVGLTKLGAHAMYFDCQHQRVGVRESVKDYAKNMERYVDGIVARVFSHDVLVGLAEHAGIPVVNALSDLEHPCQALADFMTLRERLGGLSGKKLAWVGDGNNVCHSLLLAAAKLGVDMTVITPKGFEPRFEVLNRALAAAERTGAKIVMSPELKAIRGHDAVYTDCWVSMGQDHQASLRAEAFTGWQIDEEVMGMASEGLGRPALFMHCLPAHRGEEVVDEVIDGPNSVVYDEAENRMHAQNALLLKLYGAA